ncbi:MBL fold metallo-hydrolase [Streptomyces sp. NPDC092296]|uniref:MBL fold metallo-hydrolase n=1 Tax=Streptomyces sp. NPDC092296 TaxID=3366012 RepID=UPI0038206A45
MQHIRFGDVEVIRVLEGQSPFAPAGRVFPDIAPETWRDQESWLTPDFWDPAEEMFVAALQTWVLRSEGRTILVDTGIGRYRPAGTPFGRLRSPLVDRLAAVGVEPGEVDIVVNTHLHSDHVGWNTSERDGALVPTFPHARYLIPAPDNAAVDPSGPHRDRHTGDQARQQVFTESVLPLHEAGQAVLWEGSHRLDANLTLEAAPGHTPGSSLLRLHSAGDRAVFVGDILHSPVQIPDPDCNSCFCEDPAQARATRRRVLEHAADNRELLIPAHFGGHGALEVAREGSRFAVTRWAAFS